MLCFLNRDRTATVPRPYSDRTATVQRPKQAHYTTAHFFLFFSHFDFLMVPSTPGATVRGRVYAPLELDENLQHSQTKYFPPSPPDFNIGGLTHF